MGCERRTLTESAIRGARVRLEPPNKVSARLDAWFLSNSNMSVQGAAAATSIMLMAPQLGGGGGESLPVQAVQENSHAKQGRTFTDQRGRGRLRGAQRKRAKIVTVCGLMHPRFDHFFIYLITQLRFHHHISFQFQSDSMLVSLYF